MRTVIGAAGRALGLVAVWALVMLIPGLNVLGLIAVMLPLWMVHDLGVRGLGTPREGFFVPSELGYAVGAVMLWSLCFILLLVLRSRSRD